MESTIEAFTKLLVAMVVVVTTGTEVKPIEEEPVPVITTSLLEASRNDLEEETIYGLVIPEIDEEEEEPFREILFTNFYVGDSTGSGSNTSVGLSVRDFSINSKGWYTYQDKVVIATATTLCMEVQSGPCARYNSLPKGYEVHDLWDEVEIQFEGETYEAIVLSSCGACFWEEERQRVDIFVAPQGRFGTKVGGIKH